VLVQLVGKTIDQNTLGRMNTLRTTNKVENATQPRMDWAGRPIEAWPDGRRASGRARRGAHESGMKSTSIIPASRHHGHAGPAQVKVTL